MGDKDTQVSGCKGVHSPEPGPLLQPTDWDSSDDVLRAYAAFFGILCLGAVPGVNQVNDWADLPYFVALAVLSIYIGAHRGLSSKQRQQLRVQEGLLAPVFASASLFGLYLLLKYLPDLDVQAVFGCYFWLLTVVAATDGTAAPLRRLCGPLGKKSIHIPVAEGLLLDAQGASVRDVAVAPSDLLALGLGLVLAVTQWSSHYSEYTSNNLVACLVAQEILSLVGLSSFRVAALLLGGLCLYDVFWVFGSSQVLGENVMMKVATSDIIMGPTRLLFPRELNGMGEAKDFPFSLLGLGDVAIPGFLVCLALRYDRWRGGSGAATQPLSTVRPAPSTPPASSAAVGGSSHESSQQLSLDKAYFAPIMAAYVAGLLMAFGANAVTQLGQPALLYIVPCTLGTLGATAAQRGELAATWGFKDEPSHHPVPEGSRAGKS